MQFVDILNANQIRRVNFLQENIALVGEVNYPNVIITPNMVKLPCIPIRSSDHKDLIMKNISPLPVTFHFEWLEEWFNIETVSVPEVIMLPCR